MQVTVARRVERRSVGQLGALVLLGFGAAFAVGFLLSEAFGTGGAGRMGRLLRRRPAAHAPPAKHAAALAAVRTGLAGDQVLGAEPIEVRPRGAGIELRGWVASRTARARAYRIARSAAGPFELTNHLRVLGEDDRLGERSGARPPFPAGEAPRSA